MQLTVQHAEPTLEHIVLDGLLRAILVRGSFRERGIHFFTPPDFS